MLLFPLKIIHAHNLVDSPLKASGYFVQLGHHPEVVHGNIFITDGIKQHMQHLVLVHALHVYHQMSLFQLKQTCIVY